MAQFIVQVNWYSDKFQIGCNAVVSTLGSFSQIEGLRDDEQSSFDNLPEGLQAAPNGQASEAAADALDAAVTGIDEAETSLNEAIG